MKKSIMLGVNSETRECCMLYCLLPFDKLVDEQIESNDFIHKATNWCGRDDINRTLSLINMKQTGRKIKLNKNITFHGTDSDMGHAYPWKFEIDEIHELV